MSGQRRGREGAARVESLCPCPRRQPTPPAAGLPDGDGQDGGGVVPLGLVEHGAYFSGGRGEIAPAAAPVLFKGVHGIRVGLVEDGVEAGRDGVVERGEAAGHVVQGAGAELCQGPPPPVPGEAVVLAALVFAQVVRVLHEGPRHPAQSDFEAFALGVAGDAEEGLQEQEPARLILKATCDHPTGR